MISSSSSLDGIVAGGIMLIVWTILILILAIVGGICLYIFFLSPKKEIKNKFLNWLKRFLNFDVMLLEFILKVVYIASALFITVWPLALIFMSPLGFLAALLTIILGNVGLRVMYEFMLMLIMLCKNTSEINRKIKEK